MKRLTIIFIFITLFSQAQEKVNFSEKFKRQNEGKYKVEINEVKELLQIMIAITPTGLANDDMVQQQGSYYQDVLQHFKNMKTNLLLKQLINCW